MEGPSAPCPEEATMLGMGLALPVSAETGLGMSELYQHIKETLHLQQQV